MTRPFVIGPISESFESFENNVNDDGWIQSDVVPIVGCGVCGILFKFYGWRQK